MINDIAGIDADTAADTAIHLVVVTSDTAIAFLVDFVPTMGSEDTAIDFSSLDLRILLLLLMILSSLHPTNSDPRLLVANLRF